MEEPGPEELISAMYPLEDLVQVRHHSYFLKRYPGKTCLYCGTGEPRHDSTQFEKAICEGCYKSLVMDSTRKGYSWLRK